MNIVVMGAGAIGGWVAAKLGLAGECVMAITSRGRLDAVELREAGEIKTARLTSFEGRADLLIVAVKATALEAAVETAQPFIGPKTLILPMLNGVPWWFVQGMELGSVDPRGQIARALPLERVVGCVVHASCSRSGQAVIVNHADRLILGETNGEISERLTKLNAVLNHAGLSPVITGDIRRAIWYKLWGNATINPLSALTRVTCDRILASPECCEWMLMGMSELAAVGFAVGCPITESGADRMAVTARLGAFRTSMLQDVEAGRPIELEALLGAPREIARAYEIATPALDRLYALTRLMAEGLDLT